MVNVDTKPPILQLATVAHDPITDEVLPRLVSVKLINDNPVRCEIVVMPPICSDPENFMELAAKRAIERNE
jgi:hypothetical protein